MSKKLEYKFKKKIGEKVWFFTEHHIAEGTIYKIIDDYHYDVVEDFGRSIRENIDSTDIEPRTVEGRAKLHKWRARCYELEIERYLSIVSQLACHIANL
jgi:hypothetical protein